MYCSDCRCIVPWVHTSRFVLSVILVQWSCKANGTGKCLHQSLALLLGLTSFNWSIHTPIQISFSTITARDTSMQNFQISLSFGKWVLSQLVGISLESFCNQSLTADSLGVSYMLQSISKLLIQPDSRSSFQGLSNVKTIQNHHDASLNLGCFFPILSGEKGIQLLSESVVNPCQLTRCFRDRNRWVRGCNFWLGSLWIFHHVSVVSKCYASILLHHCWHVPVWPHSSSCYQVGSLDCEHVLSLSWCQFWMNRVPSEHYQAVMKRIGLVRQNVILALQKFEISL